MNRIARPHAGLVALLALSAAAACSTGPESLDVSGTWTGTALLPNAYSTTLALTRQGNTVSGTLQIAGVLNEAFVGTLDESARTIVWTVFEGCEEWSGTFNLDSDATQMSGPVLNDQSGCSPAGTDASGTISLNKQ